MRHLRLCSTRKILYLKYQTLNLSYQVPWREGRIEAVLHEFFTLILNGRSQFSLCPSYINWRVADKHGGWWTAAMVWTTRREGNNPLHPGLTRNHLISERALEFHIIITIKFNVILSAAYKRNCKPDQYPRVCNHLTAKYKETRRRDHCCVRIPKQR